MTEPICEDEGLLQEWSPLTQLLQHIPLKIQKGLFSQNLNLTCLDVISDYIVLGTNLSIVYWYCRESGELQRLRLENSNCEITCVKVVSTVEYMVAAGTNQGIVTVFQIPKQVPKAVPSALKPKNKQIERFTINGLHNAPVTNIEWSQNGMKLFSGDKNGVVVLTEIDFAMHLTKSAELLNEHFEITQLSYSQQSLLISTIFRSVICDGTKNWEICQVGTKERKILGKFGATFCKFEHGVVLYACRPGYRLWLSDKSGVVQQTLIFKSALQSTCPKIQVINPVNKKEPYDTGFGKVIQFGDNKLIAYNSEVLYVLHPGAVSVVSVLCNVRKILDLAVNENEIFVLEGERSLLRISPVPDKHSTDMLYNSMSRKASFNLDDFAAKIKDTAVGSIKKITKDLITIPEDSSPNSPPTVADEAVELPPIVPLPNGMMPSLFPENVEVHSSIPNNSWSNSTLLNNSKTESVDNKVSNTLFNHDCHEEIIIRPLRKKRNKKPKNLLNSLVLESESDTTSTVSDDRLTWGIANDLSLSEESGISQSQSSFSVLCDIPALVQSGTGINKGAGIEEIISIADNKSQASLDTCESVSEQIPSSEKFRIEQEKVFQQLASRPFVLTTTNSEKTDNMSVSFNMTTSSSVSSKISENVASPSEYSDNSSMILGTKTSESQTPDNFLNEDQHSPENINYCPSNSNFQSCNNLSNHEKKNSDLIQSTFHSSPQPCHELNEETKNENLINSVAQESNEGVNENLSDKKNCSINSNQSVDLNEENSEIDFAINDLSDFFMKEHLDRIESSEKLTLADQFFISSKNTSNVENRKQEKKTNSDYSSTEPLTYGPPSGSSLLSSQPSSDHSSMPSQTLKQQIRDFSDHWPQHKTPESMVNLAVSKNYGLCVDINDQVYYSDLSGLALNWILLDFKASAISVSNDGSVVWLMYKKSIHRLKNHSQKNPISNETEEISSNALAFAVDQKTNDGYIVTPNGKIMHYRNSLSNDNDNSREEIFCHHFVTDIVCWNGTIVVLTENQNLLCKTSSDKSFKNLSTPKPIINRISMGPDNLLWIVDENNLIYFSDNYFEKNSFWWQIQISDYIFSNSSVTFQNLYSKIKLNSLKANVHSKNTYITSNENSVWIYEKFASTTRINKSDFTGYKWDEIFSKPAVSTIPWQAICAEGVFEDKGHVWLLSTDGNIFCLSPNSNDFQAISIPCDDDVICLASSTDTLWVLSESGRLYSRLGLSDSNLFGNSWRELKLPQIDNLKLVWVSCGCDVAWGCDVLGRTFITIGSPHHMATNIFDAAWLEVEGKPKGIHFKKVFVGPQLYMVWALDSKGNLFVREGIFSHYQIGTSWVYVGGIEAIHVSISGTSVWALGTNGRVYRRCGISDKNYIGDFWKSIPGDFKMMTSSFTDDLWGVTQENKILKLEYYIKSLDKNDKNDKEIHSEDVSWELVE